MSTLRTIARATITAATLGLASHAAAQTVTFELIPGGSFITDMSPDGRWLVGTSASGAPWRYDLVNGVGITMPAGTSASAVSDDGTRVLGNMNSLGTGQQVAGLWEEGLGWTELGGINGSDCGSISSGYELSADGTVAVGLGWNGCSGQGFVWTEGIGMQPLESLANGNNRASVVSADGQVIGGFAQGSFSRTPATWNGTSLLGDLLDPPNGDAVGEVYGISDDGSILLGAFDQDPVKWEGGMMTVLGSGTLLPGWVGSPQDIADDGTIVGFDFLLTNRIGWIQPNGEGDLVRIRDWAEANGAVIPDSVGMQFVLAISADGSVIAGSSFSQAWILRVENDQPCTGDLDGSGDVGFNDLVALLAGWGGDGAGADLAAPEDTVDFNDLVALLAVWGACP